MPQIDDLNIPDQKFSMIEYSYDEKILNDEISSEGTTRHVVFEKINGVVQREEVFSFQVIDILKTDPLYQQLEDLNGRNNVVFQPNNSSQKYVCTCASEELKYVGQEVPSFNIMMTVRSVAPTVFSMRCRLLAPPNDNIEPRIFSMRCRVVIQGNDDIDEGVFSMRIPGFFNDNDSISAGVFSMRCEGLNIATADIDAGDFSQRIEDLSLSNDDIEKGVFSMRCELLESPNNNISAGVFSMRIESL